MLTSEPRPFAAIASEQLVRLTVDDYLKMAEIGLLREGAPIELLDGVLVWKDRRDRDGSIMVIGTRHRGCVTNLHELLQLLCHGHGCSAQSQQPIQLSDRDMPEPDLIILIGAARDYLRIDPRPSDVLLVIEVADSSLKQDRSEKLPKYASAGIPEYWIVNLLTNEVEVYRRPDPATGTYAEQVNLPHDGRVPILLPDGTAAEVEVAAFIP